MAPQTIIKRDHRPIELGDHTHSTTTMTRHYSVAQIVELHAALEKVKEDSGRWNKSLQTLRREQEGQRAEATPPKSPPAKKNSLGA